MRVLDREKWRKCWRGRSAGSAGEGVVVGVLGELAFKGVFSVGFPAAWLGGFPCASGAKNGRKMAGAGPPWFSAHYLEGRFFDPMRHLEAPAALCSPAKPAIFF